MTKTLVKSLRGWGALLLAAVLALSLIPVTKAWAGNYTLDYDQNAGFEVQVADHQSDQWDKITITAKPGLTWTTPPTLVPNQPIESYYYVQPVQSSTNPNKYEAKIFEQCPAGTGFTIAGAAGVGFTAQVNSDQLENANASLSKTSGITPTDTVTLTITPNTGYAFNSAPTVVAPDGFTAGAVEAGENGAYTCPLSGFSKNATVNVSGVAEETKYPVTLNTDNLKGVATARINITEMAVGDIANVTVSAPEGSRFTQIPNMTATNARVLDQLAWDADLGCYYGRIDNPSGPVTVTVTGEAKDAKYTASLVKTGLSGADAALSKTMDITPADTVTLTITPSSGMAFTAVPGVGADGATAGPVTAGENGSYTCELSAFTKNATITVTGQAEEAEYTATLVASGLKGASASLGKSTGIKAGDTVTVTIVPEAGKAFASAPAVSATNAAAGAPAKQADGSYTCAITGFTGNSTVTVTGEAKAADKPDIKVTGNGTHVVGAGGTLTFICSLPLEDLIRVYVDGKELDKSNYDAKSGSTVVTLKAAYLDTLAEGKHTIKLSYTNDRAASLDFTVAKAKPLPVDDKGGSKIAKTGDPLDAAPLAAVAGAAGLVLLAGAALRRKQD